MSGPEFDDVDEYDTAGEALSLWLFVLLALAVVLAMIGWAVFKIVGLTLSAAVVVPVLCGTHWREAALQMVDRVITKAAPSWLMVSLGFNAVLWLVALLSWLQWNVIPSN